MAMPHRLTGGGPAVHADIEPSRCRVLSSDLAPHEVCKSLHSAMFAGEQVEVVHDVTSRNDECVKRCERIAVSNGDRERVLGYQVIVGQFAEHATLLSNVVGGTHTAEVGVVGRTFVRVAFPAERLQILGLVAAAMFARQNVVHIERPLRS
jgi:hypothetical protein